MSYQKPNGFMAAACCKSRDTPHSVLLEVGPNGRREFISSKAEMAAAPSLVNIFLWT